MDALIGIGFIAALVTVFWGFGRLTNRGTAMVTGAVTGNTRTRGLAAVHLGLRFTLPGEGRPLVDRLIETLELGPTPKDGLRLGGTDPDHTALEILVGGRGAPLAKFVVDTDPAGEGSTGTATVVSWREVEGRIPATDAIERIHQHVRAAVQRLGGSVTEFHSA